MACCPMLFAKCYTQAGQEVLTVTGKLLLLDSKRVSLKQWCVLHSLVHQPECGGGNGLGNLAALSCASGM